MFNKKLNTILFCLAAIMSNSQVSAMQQEESEYLLGLKLEEPIVRETVVQYTSNHKDNCKLAIGAGHIYDLNELHPVYKSNGSNCLTESIQGGYAFHEHVGWYTFSAETDLPFGSDMVGNIRKNTHQQLLLPENTWNLIWDESYHPDVLSAPGLLENVFNSLKHEGVFIFTFPLQKDPEGLLIAGHDCLKKTETGEFSEKLAYKELSTKFESFDGVKSFISSNLAKIGFSKSEIYESPLTIALKNLDGLSEDSYKEVLPKVREITKSTFSNPALQYDPIFEHAGLGMIYVIATK